MIVSGIRRQLGAADYAACASIADIMWRLFEDITILICVFCEFIFVLILKSVVRI